MRIPVPFMMMLGQAARRWAPAVLPVLPRWVCQGTGSGHAREHVSYHDWTISSSAKAFLTAENAEKIILDHLCGLRGPCGGI